MRKRPLPDEGADVQMRRFKRPHNSTVSSLHPGLGPSKFTLNVIICKPDFGNCHHWAIQLHNQATDDATIFEVQGTHPFYEFTTYQCRPNYYMLTILTTIRVGQFVLSSSALESMAHAIEHQVEVRNDDAEWSCQDYVLEVLDMLEDEWWLDNDDQQYLEVRRKLRGMCGPIAHVQKAVVAYSKTSVPNEESIESRPEGEQRNVRLVHFAGD